jgi:integrase
MHEPVTLIDDPHRLLQQAMDRAIAGDLVGTVVEDALSERLRLHQARHTYASFMIAAGVNPKALSAFMGHSSITVTFDLYGHLMPGTEAEGAALLNAYLSRSAQATRMLRED